MADFENNDPLFCSDCYDPFDEDEDVVEERLRAREAALGFRPQSELIFPSKFPYANEIDTESTAMWHDIKTNLGKTVLLSELRPGFIVWKHRVQSYIERYGLKFSKDDHVKLVELFFSVMTMPDVALDVMVLEECFDGLTKLLSRRYLLKPEDLTLPWRPLFKLRQSLTKGVFVFLDMARYPHTIEDNLKTVIQLCRPYFGANATKEMLEEWRPLICPPDQVNTVRVMENFELFLPTYDNDDFNLWFQEFLGFWKSCPNSTPWRSSLCTLFARLAEDAGPKIDWSSEVATLMTYIQSSLYLPVTYKEESGSYNTESDAASNLTWIVGTMGGPKSKTLDLLEHMLAALESYFLSANSGSHSWHLSYFCLLLSKKFVLRIHRERYSRKPNWGPVVPDEYKITDDEIERFVQMLQPLAIHMMSSEDNWNDTDPFVILQNLASLRPDLVIPDLIQRTFDALKTVTEPQKLPTSLLALKRVIRLAVKVGKDPRIPKSSKFGNIDITSKLIPLLFELLPGIDRNDMNKTKGVLQLISTICTFIPLVNSSNAIGKFKDLTEEEFLIMEQTAKFEHFVDAFFDQCFKLIDSVALLQTRDEIPSEDFVLAEDESDADGIYCHIILILCQCSPDLYDKALAKISRFLNGRIFEPRVAGSIAASLCRSLVAIDAKKGLGAFVPRAVAVLDDLLDDLDDKNKLNDEIKFNLLILSECFQEALNGEEILPYIDEVTKILRKCLKINTLEARIASTPVLKNILSSMTLIKPVDHKSAEVAFDADSVSIKRDWGNPGNMRNLQVNWHVPSKEEIAAVQKLVDEFLGNALDDLRTFCAEGAEGKKLNKEELSTRLTHITTLLRGAGFVLPFWNMEDNRIQIVNSVTPIEKPLRFRVKPEVSDYEMEVNFRGGNARLAILEVMVQLQDCLLKEREDDTESLARIIFVYELVIGYNGIHRYEFEHNNDIMASGAEILKDQLLGNSQMSRKLMMLRIALAHDARVIDNSILTCFTETNATIFKKLFTLATSSYSSVRSSAQNTIASMTGMRSYRLVLGRAIEVLKKSRNLSEEINHEEFKGALYVLSGRPGWAKNDSMLLKPDWDTLVESWPCLIKSKHSEKPSISALMDEISEDMETWYANHAIDLSVTADTMAKARSLLTSEIAASVVEEQRVKRLEMNKTNRENYVKLVEDIISEINSNKDLHWRHYNLAIRMIGLLTRSDIALPVSAVNLVVNNLVHDNLRVRKQSIRTLTCILQQHKRRHVKIEVKTADLTGNEVKTGTGSTIPGDKKENEFLCYGEDRIPKNQTEWDEPRFVHKSNVGFYVWPAKIEVYAPSAQQPPLNRDLGDLNPCEADIFRFFTNPDKVDKLIKYLSLEEDKLTDSFDFMKFRMFRYIFRGFGDSFVSILRHHLERLSVEEQESSQRCAAEIIAGLLRGSKLWNYKMTESLWDWLTPLFRKIKTKISVETLDDWSRCVEQGAFWRDPNRTHWLLKVMMEEPIQSAGSFADTARITLLQRTIVQYGWRVPTLKAQLLTDIAPHLTHAYRNVRTQIGDLLTFMFWCDLEYSNLPNADKCSCQITSRNPKLEEFLKPLLDKLDYLLKPETTESKTGNDDDDENNNNLVKEGLRLLETVTNCVWNNSSSDFRGPRPEYYRLLTHLCVHEGNEMEPQLADDCARALASMATALVPVKILPSFVEATCSLIESKLAWKAKTSALEFLQVAVFHNMSTLLTNEEWINKIEAVVLGCLTNQRIEVREKAGQVLGGLIHCNFIHRARQDELLQSFTANVNGGNKRLPTIPKQSPTILETRKPAISPELPLSPADSGFESPIGSPPQEISRDSGLIHDLDGFGSQSLVIQHSNVIGLCAFVNAHPYDVPEYLPGVLMTLSGHLHDRQPIPETIKKTMQDFKRTHQDQWSEHKEKFTEEQLTMLTDLLVSPGYYA